MMLMTRLPSGVVGNVVDFRNAKVDSGTLLAREVTPAEVLTQALEDLGSLNVAKCYITLVIDNGETWATTNYRANLTRAEEIAFRQLGITEMLESWRNG